MNKKETNKHCRLKAVSSQGTSRDIARNTAPKKKIIKINFENKISWEKEIFCGMVK